MAASEKQVALPHSEESKKLMAAIFLNGFAGRSGEWQRMSFDHKTAGQYVCLEQPKTNKGKKKKKGDEMKEDKKGDQTKKREEAHLG